MQFTRGRGRPKENRPTRDLGTPELIYKRAHGLTEEPLDTSLKRQLISDKQHKSGIHFRWLYTLRYGTADPTAICLDLALRDYGDIQDDPVWRESREAELAEAIDLLKQYHLFPTIRNLCVHHHMPHFLSASLCRRAFEEGDMRLAHMLNRELEHVKEGLELLSKHWKR